MCCFPPSPLPPLLPSDEMNREQVPSTSISSVSYSPVTSSAVLVRPDDRSVEDLESRNLVELRSQAKELGITFSALKKNELVHAIHAVRRYHTGKTPSECWTSVV